MELRRTSTISNDFHRGNYTFDNSGVEERLSWLIAANRKIERERSLYRSDRERFEAAVMSRPIPSEKVFAYFGLLLGSLPPVSIFSKFLYEKGFAFGDDTWILGLLMLTTLGSSAAGFLTGKQVAKVVRYLYGRSVHSSILLLPLVGLLWGMAAGGAGGFFLFIVGAVFGAVIGGTVGAIALPAFVLFHRLLKRGDVIEMRHLLPLSFGITLTICAFILGW